MCRCLQGKCGSQSFDSQTQSLCAMLGNMMFTKYDFPIEPWFQEQHGQRGLLAPALRSHFMHPVCARRSL